MTPKQYIQSTQKLFKQCYQQAFRVTIARRNASDVSDTELHDDRRYGLISRLVDSYPDKLALRNQIMQLLVTGCDTMAVTLAWALILLETHPENISCLHKAVIEAFGYESNQLPQ